jgi:hypothetical protein
MMDPLSGLLATLLDFDGVGSCRRETQPVGQPAVPARSGVAAVDGFDELPVRHRQKVQGWLEDMVRAFPDA